VSKFPIIQIPVPGENESESILEGAIDKYWLELPDLGRSLVKVDNRGAWVEKVVATLAKKVELPVARYELAERDDGSKLIVSPSFLLGDGQETTGEKLLVDALGRNYLYTPKAMLSVVDNLDISLPSNYIPPETCKASDILVGYLIFDSWIGNIDRHSRNWGIQETLDGRRELLPTFDHGLSLGVRMPEDKLPSDVTAFSEDCMSSIQGEVSGMLTMDGLARRLLELKPEAARSWIGQIIDMDIMAIRETIESIPEGWISDVRAKFTIEFLEASSDRLMELYNESNIWDYMTDDK
jgi:hypothetical protein